MVKNDTISSVKANRLYWLGRYEERAYLTLHLLRKCYDRMIDGEPTDYQEFWRKLDASGSYANEEEFRLGMLYDEHNPSSLHACLNRAMDNAIMLREDIKSETLSFIEISLSLIHKLQTASTDDILRLQPITDWSLAFWGSVTERMTNRKALNIMMTGRIVEHIDMLLRYNYPKYRVNDAYKELKHLSRENYFDTVIKEQLNELIGTQKQHLEGENKLKALKYINNLVLL